MFSPGEISNWDRFLVRLFILSHSFHVSTSTVLVVMALILQFAGACAWRETKCGVRCLTEHILSFHLGCPLQNKLGNCTETMITLESSWTEMFSWMQVWPFINNICLKQTIMLLLCIAIGKPPLIYPFYFKLICWLFHIWNQEPTVISTEVFINACWHSIVSGTSFCC